MAQQFMTGPCDIFVNYGTSSSGDTPAVFLGHSERGPRIQIRPQYTMTFVDITGQRVPFDAIYDGEDGIVSLHLTRWNPAVYDRISKKVRLPGVTTPRGLEKPGEVGTLMVYEGSATKLWIKFTHSAKQSYDDMETGYRFHAAFLQTEDMTDLGTKPRKIHLVWHCLRKGSFQNFNSASGVATIAEYTLFDHDMDGLPETD